MKLKDYLELPGNSATKLANEVDVAVSTITRLAKGDTVPSHKLIADIAEKTNGAVMPNDFFDLQVRGRRDGEKAAA